MPNQDNTYSKYMADKFSKFYYGTRGLTGSGAEERELRALIDGLALRHEMKSDTLFPLFLDVNQVPVAAGLSGAKLYHNGLPTGYEKATKTGAYALGKNATFTANKPGELGNKITVSWTHNAGALAVTLVGTALTISVADADTSKPSDITALINADPKMKGLLVLTSTDDTAILHTSAIMYTTWTLAGGTGTGWGMYVEGTWGSTSSILFLANQPKSHYDYYVEWVAGAAAGVVVTRKGITITYINGATTANAIVALVNADAIAKEHLKLCAPTGSGAGVLAGLDGQKAYLTEDAGTMLLFGTMMATITSITSTYVQFDLAALSNSVNGMLSVDVRLCMMHIGSMCVMTDLTDVESVVSSAATGDVAAATNVEEDTGGAVDITRTLYVAAAGNKGRRVGFKKIDAGAGRVIIAGNAQTIDGVASIMLTNQYDCVIVESNGAGWDIVGAYPVLLYPPTAVDFGATAPYVVLATDKVIEVTTGAVSDDTDLPTAVGCAGRIITVKKVDGGIGVVSVDPSGAEVIEALGAGVPFALSVQGESVTLQSNGVKWYVLHTTISPAAHAAATHYPSGSDEYKPPAVDTAAATPFAVLATHRTLLCAATGGADQVVNLYAAGAGVVGRRLTFVKTDVNAHGIVVTPNGADTINGLNNATLSTLTAQWDHLTLECVAADAWMIVASLISP